MKKVAIESKKIILECKCSLSVEFSRKIIYLKNRKHLHFKLNNVNLMPKMIYYLILVHIIISGNCIWRINIEDWLLIFISDPKWPLIQIIKLLWAMMMSTVLKYLCQKPSMSQLGPRWIRSKIAKLWKLCYRRFFFISFISGLFLHSLEAQEISGQKARGRFMFHS